jgi:hypothetical protein
MKKKKFIVHQASQEDEFDLSKEHVGATFEVICQHEGKFKVELVDVADEVVRVSSLGNTNVWPKYVVEGYISTVGGQKTKLEPYASLPCPPGTLFCPIVEKVRRF